MIRHYQSSTGISGYHEGDVLVCDDTGSQSLVVRTGAGLQLEPYVMEYRAYDLVTEWSGPVRTSRDAAELDAEEHAKGCAKQGGYSRAIVVTRDPEAPGRLVDMGGETMWPPYGRTNGAARWRP